MNDKILEQMLYIAIKYIDNLEATNESMKEYIEKTLMHYNNNDTSIESDNLEVSILVEDSIIAINNGDYNVAIEFLNKVSEILKCNDKVDKK